MRVLILKKYPEEISDLIKDLFPPEWEVFMEVPEYADVILKKADILIPSHKEVDESVICKAPNLKIIQTGAGFDNVDIELCRKKGIRVLNAPSVNTNEVAEHTFAFIFRKFKKIYELDNEIKSAGWSFKKEGKSFSDLTIGIIGYGNIGKKVALTAQVFGMKVLVFSEHENPGYRDGIKFSETLDTLLSDSDIVTVHTSASKEKFNMISDREFSLMKKDVFLINTARGSLLDENALCRALDRGSIGGAGLDVFKTEPLPENSRLRNYSDIIMTPHNAGEPDLYNSYKKRFEFFSMNIQKALKNINPEGVIV